MVSPCVHSPSASGRWPGAAASAARMASRAAARYVSGRASTHLMSLSTELEHQSADLQSEVGKFVDSLRAA